jgi:hypothetical protein
MASWQPPWSQPDIAAARLAVTSTLVGRRVCLEISKPVPGLVTWLKVWIAAYLRRLPDHGLDDADFSFVYITFGSIVGRAPDGIVDGVAVLEAGYGGDPVGPAEAAPATVAALFGEALDALS